MRLNLSVVEMVQVGALGMYSVYALAYYAMRRERVVDMTSWEGICFGAVGSMLLSSMGISLCRRGGGVEGGEREGRSVASRRLGKEKSVWEGGRRGVSSRSEWGGRDGRDESGGEFGDAGDQHFGVGDGEGDAAFNPGLM